MSEVDRQLQRRALAAVRRGMPCYAWDDYANAIAADRRDHEEHLRLPDDKVDRSLIPMLDKFRGSGLVSLPFRLATDDVANMRRHLETMPAYAGTHIFSSDFRPRPLDEVRRSWPNAGYTVDQLLRTPGIVDLLNHPAIVDFIEAYLGCVPTLYSINAWWSFPGTVPQGLNSQFFHRDTDDWRFCVLFFYMTDVDTHSGPHQLITGSHSLQGMTALVDRARARGKDVSKFDVRGSFVRNFSSELSASIEDLFSDTILSVVGQAGSMFIANTLALHRGLVPSREPRLMLWARYGLGPNTNSADLEQGPLSRSQVAAGLPDTPRNRYVNRLLFEFDRGPI